MTDHEITIRPYHARCRCGWGYQPPDHEYHAGNHATAHLSDVERRLRTEGEAEWHAWTHRGRIVMGRVA